MTKPTRPTHPLSAPTPTCEGTPAQTGSGGAIVSADRRHPADRTSVVTGSPAAPSPGRSWIVGGFVIVAALILPLIGLGYGWFAIIDRGTERALERLQQRMAVIASTVEGFAGYHDGVKVLMHDLNQRWRRGASPREMARLAQRIERAHPGLIRWLIWDEHGRPLKGRARFLLAGSRFWSWFIIGAFRSRGLTANLPDAASLDLTLAGVRYHQAFGFNQALDHLIRMAERAHEFAGQPMQLYVWSGWPAIRLPPGRRGGCLLAIDRSRLPDQLWLRRYVQSRAIRNHGADFPMIAIDLENPGRGIISGFSPRRTRRFLARARRAFLARESDTLQVDSFLIRMASTESASNWRFGVLGRAGPLLEAGQRRKRRVLATLLALAVAVLVAAHWGPFRRWPARSLRVRIASLFTLTLLLPLSGLVLFGWLLAEQGREYSLARIREAVRQTVEALEARRDEAGAPIERLLRRVIIANGDDKQNLQTLRRALDRLVVQQVIYKYFVSDHIGRVEFQDSINPRLPEAESAVGMVFRLSLDRIRPGINRTALLDAVVQDSFTALGGNPDVLAATARLRPFRFGNADFQVFQAPVRSRDGFRVVAAVLMPVHLERQFLLREFREQGRRRHSGLDSPCEFFFRSVSATDSFCLPPGENPAWPVINDDVIRSWWARIPTEREIVIEGEPFLFYTVRLRQLDHHYLAVLTSLLPRERRSAELHRLLVGLGAVILLLTLVVSLMLAGSLVEPIARLDAVARQLALGRLDLRVPPLGEDELGRLATTFNAMVQAMRERERMRAYVSESVLEAVKDDQAAALGRTGRIEDATVLFSDIRGFTTLAERHPPTEMFAMLNSFLGRIEPIIRYHHGRIDKFIGDAVMAVFLATSPGDTGSAPIADHPERAVRVALAMQRAVVLLNRKRAREGRFPIAIGVGISTGLMLLGDVGSRRRKDLTVIGDEVNLAARLETASKEGRHTRIVISQTTRARVEHRVETVEMPLTEVKGKQQPVRIFEVVRWRGDDPPGPEIASDRQSDE